MSEDFDDTRFDCQTIGCTIGWAYYYKPFIKQGFKQGNGGAYWEGPSGKQYEGDTAIAKFFRIPVWEVKEIIYPPSYRVKSLIEGKNLKLYGYQVKTEHVITRVEKLIRRYKRGK